MSDESEYFKKALQDIARILDTIEYECIAHTYTLDEEEISWVFYCRDLAQWTLRNGIKKNE